MDAHERGELLRKQFRAIGGRALTLEHKPRKNTAPLAPTGRRYGPFYGVSLYEARCQWVFKEFVGEAAFADFESGIHRLAEAAEKGFRHTGEGKVIHVATRQRDDRAGGKTIHARRASEHEHEDPRMRTAFVGGQPLITGQAWLWLVRTCICWMSGILFVYWLASVGPDWPGPVMPLGGILLLAGAEAGLIMDAIRPHKTTSV